MAVPLTLDIVHETHYAYAAPVALAHHLARLQPLADPAQALHAFALEVDPPPTHAHAAPDHRGNACHWFSVVGAHGELTVRAASRVRVAPRFDALDAAASPPWEAVAARLRYVARAAYDPAVEFTMPSPYVPRLEALRRWALPSFPAARPVAAGAIELMHRIHGEFSYAAASTQIDTPLAQVLEQKSGVCQDFAHLMMGALRMLGLPARYVSGYLLTRAPGEAAPAFVGADASHAWVQVYCPGTPGVAADGWLDLDPTNDVVPAAGHVRVAVGRDYGDVTPLRGVIRGGGRHTLRVGVHTQVVGA